MSNRPSTGRIQGRTSILVVDDHEVVRAGIRDVLSFFPRFVVDAEASTGADAMSQLMSRKFDLVILDLSLPDQDGLSVLEEIRLRDSHMPVIVFTGHRDVAGRAIRLGAAGFLSKTGDAQQLVDAVTVVSGGGSYIPPGLEVELAREIQRQATEPAYDKLSAREREVMSLVLCGNRTKEIAGKLNLSPKTISTFRARVLRKLNVTGEVELIRYAMRCGLLPVDGKPLAIVEEAT